LSNFFFSKVWNISYRSKHKYSDNLLEQVEKYASARLENQSKLITKVTPGFIVSSETFYIDFEIHVFPMHQVAALMECDNVDDFIDKKSDEQVKKDLVLACKRFPSIILGDSRPVELYSNSKSYGESSSILKTPTDNSFLPTPMHGGWFDPDNLSRTLSSFCPELLQNDDSSDPREDILDDGSSFTSKTATSEVEATSDDVFAAQRFLATSIDSMPGLSKRHSNQLDSCGFHTVCI